MSYHDDYREKQAAKRAFLESLTSGTEVFITRVQWKEKIYQRVAVSRVTKTQIIFDNFFHSSPIKFYKEDGKMVGSKGQSAWNNIFYGIEPDSEENRKAISRQREVNLVYGLLKKVKDLGFNVTDSLDGPKLRDLKLALEDVLTLVEGDKPCQNTTEA